MKNASPLNYDFASSQNELSEFKWGPDWYLIYLNEFYFWWLENSVIEIGNTESNPLIFNHLKWNSSKSNYLNNKMLDNNL